jgi:hypothetical protein
LPDVTTVIVLGTGVGGNDAAVCSKVTEAARIVEPKFALVRGTYGRTWDNSRSQEASD